jgi:hypothetical protein
MPGVKVTFPKTNWGKMSYLGAAGAALVAAAGASVAAFGASPGLGVPLSLLQPVNTAPVTSPISTIKVDIRFIRAIQLMKSAGLTRKIFNQFLIRRANQKGRSR